MKKLRKDWISSEKHTVSQNILCVNFTLFARKKKTAEKVFKEHASLMLSIDLFSWRQLNLFICPWLSKTNQDGALMVHQFFSSESIPKVVF